MSENGEAKASKTIDELTVIRSCMTQLRKLSAQGQLRVARYLMDRANEAHLAEGRASVSKAAKEDMFE